MDFVDLLKKLNYNKNISFFVSGKDFLLVEKNRVIHGYDLQWKTRKNIFESIWCFQQEKQKEKEVFNRHFFFWISIYL